MVLQIFNKSNIEQLGVSSVKLRHKDKAARCRIFVVTGDGPALLGMPDIELLVILKITCEVIEDQQVGRKFDSQAMEPNGTLNCRASMENKSRSDGVDVINNNLNMSDYFSANKETHKETCRFIIQNFTANLMMYSDE